VLQQLEAANRLNLHPRDREVAELARTISEARKSQGKPTNNR
jgi:hypothetical protein